MRYDVRKPEKRLQSHPLWPTIELDEASGSNAGGLSLTLSDWTLMIVRRKVSKGASCHLTSGLSTRRSS
jgi:hypothetical protein